MLKKIAIAVVATTLLLMAGVFLFAKDIEVTVTEAEAQAAIDEYLTLNKPERFGIALSPEYIRIDFKNGNFAEVESKMTIEGHGYQGQFDGTFSTGIDYKVPRLYLDNPTIIEGEFEADSSVTSELNDMRQSAIDFIERQRQYDPEIDTKIGSSKTTEDYVEEMVIRASNYMFESIPIYDLRRAGKYGAVASLALKDVQFTEDSAIVTLSPVTALLRILAAIGIVLLGLIYFLGPHLLAILLERRRIKRG